MKLNRTIDYIRDYLGENLSLTRLFGVACFSKYHFHPIFRNFLGETVNAVVRRVRLEKAVLLLTMDGDKSVLDIALDCGSPVKKISLEEDMKSQPGCLDNAGF
ncbi:conserved hypothetical protein [delta proteobacterium NaphS2]|nr:conserved hypothetical protein [delta proteobacterium NaphS2]